MTADAGAHRARPADSRRSSQGRPEKRREAGSGARLLASLTACLVSLRPVRAGQPIFEALY